MTFSVADSAVGEPISGSIDIYFTVVFSIPSNGVGSLRYATVDGTATHGGDYGSISGIIRLRPGRTAALLHTKVYADKISGPNEYFFVQLSDAKGGAIVRGTAKATILGG